MPAAAAQLKLPLQRGLSLPATRLSRVSEIPHLKACYE